MGTECVIFSASGVQTGQVPLNRAKRRLQSLGFSVELDPSVKHRFQRFAGTDEQRLDTIHRIAARAPAVAMASRGGYGLTRLLDRLDWDLVASSVDRGTQWVGYSDWTAFQLALLAHTGRSTWHGPMASDAFGHETGLNADCDEANEVSCECLAEAVTGVLEAIGFRVARGFSGLERQGPLWGGNLSMVCSLLGTRHWPEVNGGLLFLEDVGEHPYRVERMLLQLQQVGVLDNQAAVLLGQFSAWKPSPLDKGYGLKQAVDRVRSVTTTPILSGIPVGHVPLNMALPQGRVSRLVVEGQSALLHWD